MYYLIDKNGCVRGQTSDLQLLEPLKNALEFIFNGRMFIVLRTSSGNYVYGM